jgi:hypothetical protein
MAHASWIAALALVAAAAPLAAAPGEQAPAGTSGTRYCMKVEAVTGTRLERTECWTRAQWADQGVDVDRDWLKEGVRTIG